MSSTAAAANPDPSSGRVFSVSSRSNRHNSRVLPTPSSRRSMCRRLRSRQFQPLIPFRPVQRQRRGFPPEEDFGDSIGIKSPKVFRLGYGNINGFPAVPHNNPKAGQLRHWFRHMDIDFFAGNESKINWAQMPPSGRLPELFRSENDLRTVAAFNSNESFGLRQFGGTFHLTMGQMASNVSGTGVDDRNLGRWAWTRFSGRNGHSTRIVSVYVPCRSMGEETVYKQHTRHLRRQGILTCPRQVLLQDLRALLISWRQAGDRIIVFLDANEDMTSGPFFQMLTGNGLHMKEAVFSKYPDPRWRETATFQSGDRSGRFPIDGCFITPDLNPDAATWLAVSGCPGDHRFLIMDICMEALVGENLFRVVRPSARRLSCTIPEAQEQYSRLLSTFFHSHKLLASLHRLYQTRQGDFTAEQSAQLEGLDMLRSQGMLYAEKRCRKLAMGSIDFSPEVAAVRLRRWFWKRLIARKMGRRVSTLLLQRTAKKCGITDPFAISLEEAKQQLEVCEKSYADLRRRAPELRREFLQGLATNESGDIEPKSQQAARRLLQVERQRSEARHLRQVLGRATGGAISRVSFVSEDDVIEVDTQAEVECHTMAECLARFRLTEGTPPMMEPLRSELGYLGTTEAARQILAGTYVPPPGVDAVTSEFLAALQATAPLDPANRISCEITRQDFQQHWRKARERTSSSLSGLHYGHYKAAAASEFLSEIHALMTELAVTGGSPFRRWQSGLSVMLEKQRGVYRVDKLRAILLMEADFNFYNGLMFAKRMISRAERNAWIPREIYGGRKNHEAIEVALNRRLITDISRQRRTPLAVASVDAQNCYDRIAHSIASLAAQRLQVDPRAIVAMLFTIQGMRFFLRTAFGDSTAFYGGRQTVPLQGGCQGNKGTPALWLVISLVLIRMMHRLALLSQIRAAYTAASVALAGFLFVDDTDLIAFPDSTDETLEIVLERMQHAVSAWHGGLRATGGALKPEKCSWSLAAFVWSNGKWRYAMAEDQPGEILVPDLDGTVRPITRIEPSEAVKVVGVYQAMDGNMKAQVAALTEKANEWSVKLAAGWLPRHLAHHGFYSMMWASLKYPLPACTITEKQGLTITKELYKALLPKMGTNRTYPTVYRHAPAALQGLGLPRLHIEQGISQIRQVLMHGAIDSTTGILMRVSFEQAQLEVGIGVPFLSASFDFYGFLLTDSWWRSVWEFTWRHRIQLSMTSPDTPVTRRQNDAFIMERLVNQPGLSRSELVSCNRCRLYLQALTMADITTGCGREITDEARSLTLSSSRPSQWIWPVERPSRTQDLRAWRRGLQLLSSSAFILRRGDQLGAWTALPHQNWDWYHVPGVRRLYFRSQSGWVEYRSCSLRRRREMPFKRTGVIRPVLPRGAQRATAIVDWQGVATCGGSAPDCIPTTDSFDSIGELIASWKDFAWPLQDSVFPDDLAPIAASLRNGTAIGCCDGSYMPKLSTSLGAAAWKLEDPTTGVAIRGATQTSGGEKDVNSYRSELQGLYTILLGTYAVCLFCAIREGAMTVGCDNLECIRLARGDWLKVNQNTPHADLIRAIRRLTALLPVKVDFTHVKGHQDRMAAVATLPRLSQLNIEMDSDAKTKLRSLVEARAKPLLPAGVLHEGWVCIVDGVKVTGDPGPAVQFSISSGELQRHLQERSLLSPARFWCIDWAALDHATATFPPLYRMWMSKHVSGFFGCGKMMKHWGFWSHSRCPCCEHIKEDKAHLLTCPASSCVAKWLQSVQGLGEWMEEVDTHPEITKCIIRALRSRAVTWSFVTDCSPEVSRAAASQDHLGWVSLTEGRISTHWRQLQAEHYRSLQSPRSAGRWAAGLVSSLLQVTHGQWVHRNHILHEKDEHGLRAAERHGLDQAIVHQFQSGLDGLHPRDFHLLERDQNSVLRLTGPGKKAWLASVRVARETYANQAEREVENMRSVMQQFLLH